MNSACKLGNRSDRIDARKLAELLRGLLSAIYHGEIGISVRAWHRLFTAYPATVSLRTSNVVPPRCSPE